MDTAVIVAALFLAFANGSNDTMKGTATLAGSGVMSARIALLFAVVTTLVGSLLCLLVAPQLIAAFSGKGLVSTSIAADPSFILAVSLGSGATVIVATLLRMPISTTHAIIGGLVGSGLAFAGTALNVVPLLGLFVLPLLLSPILAGLIAAGTYATHVWIRNRTDSEFTNDFQSGKESNTRLTRFAHIFTAGSVGLARGLNDSPKIAGLLLVVPYASPEYSVVAVAFIMALGGILASKKVGVTMSNNITSIDHTRGVNASFVTAFLVGCSSVIGLPVSTTLVAVGSIAGVGARGGDVRSAMLKKIGISWLITLPTAIGLSAAVATLLQYYA